MFTEEDGTTIDNEDIKNFQYKKMLTFTQFCNY